LGSGAPLEQVLDGILACRLDGVHVEAAAHPFEALRPVVSLLLSDGHLVVQLEARDHGPLGEEGGDDGRHLLVVSAADLVELFERCCEVVARPVEPLLKFGELEVAVDRVLFVVEQLVQRGNGREVALG
jgi:hypothetical protein